MEKDFRYYLIDEQGRSYYVKADGTVGVSSNPVDLVYTPDGWQDKSIAYGRSTRFPGMIRSFTVPLRFVEDGAKILRYVYFKKGIQGVCNLGIAKRDIVDSTDVYRKYYTGAVDFSQFNYQDRVVQANVMEGGLSELIKANESTKYEIPITVPEAISVTFDGITLLSVVNAINYADLIVGDDGTTTPNIIYSTYIFIGMSVLDTETKYPSMLFATTTTYKGAESLDYDPNDWFAEADISEVNGVDVEIKGTFNAFVAGSNGVKMLAYIRLGGVARTVDLFPITPPIPTTGYISVDVNTTIHLLPSERMWIVINNTGGGAGKGISFQVDNRFTFTYNYRKPATQILCLRPFYVFDQLIKKITNGKYGASSTLLNGDAANVVLTCGDAIRGFIKGTPSDYEGPVIKTSLNDFIDSYNVKFNVGLGIKDVAVLERKSAYFNNDVRYNLGNVANLQVIPATDHIFNKVTIGYTDQNYEDVNGRNEFNTTHTYTTAITRVSKELALTSVYRADAYGIEFTRINLENKTTTDSDSDDSVFMVNINNALGLNRPPYSSITGVPNNTVFNVELSPKTCLLAHGNYLRVGLDKLETTYLTYQTNSTKNANLSRTLNGVTITENANVQVSTLAAPLFLPHIIQFDAEVPINIVDLMESDPYGLLAFEWNGDTFYGFVLEVTQQPALNPSQTFKLLASTLNDMSKLI